MIYERVHRVECHACHANCHMTLSFGRNQKYEDDFEIECPRCGSVETGALPTQNFTLYEEVESFDVFYHVTTDEHLKEILSNGLIPQIGPRSEQIESTSAIYLFSTYKDAETALYQWLGDEFDGYEGEVHTLEVSIPPSIPVISTCEWERVCHVPIPAKHIRYYKNEG